MNSPTETDDEDFAGVDSSAGGGGSLRVARPIRQITSGSLLALRRILVNSPPQPFYADDACYTEYLSCVTRPRGAFSGEGHGNAGSHDGGDDNTESSLTVKSVMPITAGFVDGATPLSETLASSGVADMIPPGMSKALREFQRRLLIQLRVSQQQMAAKELGLGESSSSLFLLVAFNESLEKTMATFVGGQSPLADGHNVDFHKEFLLFCRRQMAAGDEAAVLSLGGACRQGRQLQVVPLAEVAADFPVCLFSFEPMDDESSSLTYSCQVAVKVAFQDRQRSAYLLCSPPTSPKIPANLPEKEWPVVFITSSASWRTIQSEGLWQVCEPNSVDAPQWLEDYPLLINTMVSGIFDKNDDEVQPQKTLKSGEVIVYSKDDELLAFEEHERWLVEDLVQVMMGLNGSLITKYVNSVEKSRPVVQFDVELPIQKILKSRNIHVPLEQLPYVLKVHETDAENNPNTGIFVEPNNLNMSLLRMTNKILEVAKRHHDVLTFVEYRKFAGDGRTAHAMTAALIDLLADFDGRLVQLSTAIRDGSPSACTLQALWYYLQPAFRTFNQLSSIATSCFHLRGGELIRQLEKLLETSSENSRRLYEYIIDRVTKPHCESVNQWLSRGILSNESADSFFIQRAPADTPAHDRGSETGTGITTTDESQIPHCYMRHQDRMLKTGHYLQILSKCSENHRQHAGEIVPNFVSINSILNAGVIEGSIRHAHEWTSQRLFDVVMHEKRFLEHLNTLKNFFLLGRSDYLRTFIELVDNAGELREESPSLLKLDAWLEKAVQASSLKTDHRQANLSLRASAFPLQHLVRSQDPQCRHILDYRHALGIAEDAHPPGNLPASSRRDHGVDAFKNITLSYNADWPLQLVFTENVMVKYSMLFRLLVQFKLVEYELQRVWKNQMITRDRVQISHTFSQLNRIRQKMIQFVQTFIFFISEEVIQGHYKELLRNISHVGSFESLKEVHGVFIDDCLRDSMMKDCEIFRRLLKVLTGCALFSRHAKRYGSSVDLGATQSAALDNDQNFIDLIRQFDERFDRSVEDLLKRHLATRSEKESSAAANLLTRLDFNMFYAARYGVFLPLVLAE